jgi:subtilase family serine protease
MSKIFLAKFLYALITYHTDTNAHGGTSLSATPTTLNAIALVNRIWNTTVGWAGSTMRDLDVHRRIILKWI